MKKKLFSVMAMATALFVASCSNDDFEQGMTGNEATISFNLGVENGVQTRAISDGTTATKLVYAVYNVNDLENPLPVFDGVNQKTEILDSHIVGKENAKTVAITLAKGQTYMVAFWAQNPECKAYNTEKLHNIKIDYDGYNNDETRDAFYKAVKLTVTGDAEQDIILKRPFAQLNVGVTQADWTAAVNSGVTIKKSSVIINNAATELNLLDGNVKGETAVTVQYNSAEIPADPQFLNVDVNKDGKIADDGSESFHWLSMSYILVNDETEGGAEKATLTDVDFTFYPEAGNNIILDEGLNNVPVRRNWRTNIIGKMLTGDIIFSIYIDPIYDNNYIYNWPDGEEETNEIAPGVSYDAATETFSVYDENGLKWIADQTNGVVEKHALVAPKASTKAEATYGNFEGQTIKLTQDINLPTNQTWYPIGTKTVFKGTFDGNNNTINNLKVRTTGKASAGLFATAQGVVKNVILKEVSVEGQFKAGAVVGDGLCSQIENCHVDGGKVISTPCNKDDGNNVGGIVGYLSAEPKASVTNCSVKNLTVTGYRDVGGIAGTANAGTPVVEDNIVDNVLVIADQSGEYLGEEPANAAEVVGRNLANIDLSKNTVNNVTVSSIKAEDNGLIRVSTADQLFAVAARVNSGENFAGKTIWLENDINLAGKPWTPMGNVNNYPTTAFDGKFYGRGYTISNLNVSDNTPVNAAAGFIGGLTGTIENVKFKNVTVRSTHYAGPVVAYISQAAAVVNCHVDGGTIISVPEMTADGYDNGDKAGGIVGFTAGGNIKECTVKNITVTAYRDLGGIAGFVRDCEVTNNQVLDNVTLIQNNTNGYQEGDITTIASIAGRNGSNVDLSSNTGTATIMHYIADGVVKNGEVYELSNANGLVYANGNLFATSGNSYKLMNDIDMKDINGYVSTIGSRTAFTFDGNGKTISNWSTTEQALFVIHCQESLSIKNLTLKNCIVSGAPLASGNVASGMLAGWVDAGTGNIAIENCHIIGGSVNGNDYAAGLIGYNSRDTETLIDKCSVENATITGGGSTGAFGGQMGYGKTYKITEATVTGCKIKGEKKEKTGIIIGSVNDCDLSITTTDVSANTVFDVANSAAIVGRFINNSGKNVLTVNGTPYIP